MTPDQHEISIHDPLLGTNNLDSNNLDTKMMYTLQAMDGKEVYICGEKVSVSMAKRLILFLHYPDMCNTDMPSIDIASHGGKTYYVLNKEAQINLLVHASIIAGQEKYQDSDVKITGDGFSLHIYEKGRSKEIDDGILLDSRKSYFFMPSTLPATVDILTGNSDSLTQLLSNTGEHPNLELLGQCYDSLVINIHVNDGLQIVIDRIREHIENAIREHIENAAGLSLSWPGKLSEINIINSPEINNIHTKGGPIELLKNALNQTEAKILITTGPKTRTNDLIEIYNLVRDLGCGANTGFKLPDRNYGNFKILGDGGQWDKAGMHKLDAKIIEKMLTDIHNETLHCQDWHLLVYAFQPIVLKS